MRAVQIDRFGGPEVVVHRELAVPSPGPGELVVKLSHAGINFMDVHTRQGKYATSSTYPMKLPVTLGMEGAGRVVAVGTGVGGWAVGDRAAYCLVRGSYADYALIPADRAVGLPSGLSEEMAAASLFHGLTAHYLANDVGALKPGMSCLVHAGSGGIGQILIQLAKRAGARVFATASTDAKRQVAFACGADEAMGYEAGGFADRVRASTGGLGVDVVFDSVGKDTLRDSFRATRKRGLVAAYGTASGSLKDLDPIELGEAGSLYLTRPRLADHVAGPDLHRRAADIFAGLAQGWLKVGVSGRYRLEDVGVAHARLSDRSMVGKPILVLGEADLGLRAESTTTGT